jgi:hypothetical protein
VPAAAEQAATGTAPPHPAPADDESAENRASFSLGAANVGAVTMKDDWQRWRQRFDKTHNGVIRLFHDRAISTILAMLDANPAVTRGGHGE